MLQVVVAQFSGMAVIMDKRERMRRFVSTRRDISLLLIVFVYSSTGPENSLWLYQSWGWEYARRAVVSRRNPDCGYRIRKELLSL